MNEQAPDSQPSNPQEVKKEKLSDIVGRGLSKLVEAEVELLGGLAEASGRGIRAAGRELTKDGADWPRGVAKGVGEGSAAFLEDVAKTIRRTGDILVDTDTKKPGA